MGRDQVTILLEVYAQDGLGTGIDFRMLRLNQDPSSGIKERWVRGRIKPNPLIFTDEEMGRKCPSPKF